MVRGWIFSAILFLAALTLVGEMNSPTGIVSGKRNESPAGYVPPLVSNGRLSMLVDWTCGMHPRHYARMRPAIYWAGRRIGSAQDLMDWGSFVQPVTIDRRTYEYPESWEQELDVHRALLLTRHTYPNGISVSSELFVPLDADLIVCRRRVISHAEKPHRISLSLRFNTPGSPLKFGAWKWNEECQRAVYDFRWFGEKPRDGCIVLYKGKDEGIHHDLQIQGGGSPIANGTLTTGQGAIQSIGETFTLPPGTEREATFFIHFADEEKGSRFAEIERMQKEIRRTGYAALRARHIRRWADYYGESLIRIPDAKVQRMIDVAQYHLRANATPWSFPVGIFPTHWHGRFFGWDEMFCYQGLAAANHLEVSRRCPEFRKSILPHAIMRARHYHTGPTYGARYLWESREDGKTEGAPLGFWLDHIFHTSNIARSAWLQYLYSDDLDYLKQTGYPVIYECAQYFRKNFVYEDSNGECYIGKCTDLERLGPSRDRPFMTTCGAIATLRAAADASEILRTNLTTVADFRTVADRLVLSLPHADGAYVAYRGCREPSVATLGGLFPYPIFGKDNGLQREAALRFIRNGRAAGNMYPVGKGICPWYAGKMAVAMTLLEDREEPARLLREAAGVAGLFGETYEINEPGRVVMHPWFATASGNCVYALCQMLLCDAEGMTFIGRGIPKDWKNYAFKLPCYGGVLVDAEVRKGRLCKLRLIPRHPERGHRLTLACYEELLRDVSLSDTHDIRMQKRAGKVLISCTADRPRMILGPAGP